MSHDRFLDACALYALGALDGEDLRELEAHLAGGCAECERALAEMEDTVFDLAAAAPPARPSPELRERVLKVAARPRWRGWAAAAAVAAVALIVWLVAPREPKWKTFELAATEAAPAGLAATAKWDPETGRAVLEFRNYAAPAGKAYELWAIRPGNPVPQSLGLVRTDAQGRATVEIDDVGTFDALAVSLEPATGAPAGGGPTGPVVSAGSPG